VGQVGEGVDAAEGPCRNNVVNFPSIVGVNEAQSWSGYFCTGPEDDHVGNQAPPGLPFVRRSRCRVLSGPRRIVTRRFPDVVTPHGRRRQTSRATFPRIVRASGEEGGARSHPAMYDGP